MREGLELIYSAHVRDNEGTWVTRVFNNHIIYGKEEEVI